VQVTLPVGETYGSRSRRGLLGRMAGRRDESRDVDELVCPVVRDAVLAGFEALRQPATGPERQMIRFVCIGGARVKGVRTKH